MARALPHHAAAPVASRRSRVFSGQAQLLLRLVGDDGLPDLAQMLVAEIEEGMRLARPRYQFLDHRGGREGEPQRDVPGQVTMQWNATFPHIRAAVRRDAEG
jgi:hypothetical protein